MSDPKFGDDYFFSSISLCVNAVYTKNDNYKDNYITIQTSGIQSVYSKRMLVCRFKFSRVLSLNSQALLLQLCCGLCYYLILRMIFRTISLLLQYLYSYCP